MLMALMLAILNSAGVAPTPSDLQNYKLKFRERGHHIHMDFGSTRTPQEGGKALTWGLGYEYYVHRKYNGVSFEVLGQKLGKLFRGPQDWWVGGGIAWWPWGRLSVLLLHAGHHAVHLRSNYGPRTLQLEHRREDSILNGLGGEASDAIGSGWARARV